MIDLSFVLKFIKFGVVGIMGMMVDFGLTYLLKEPLKVNKYIANSIGFTFAATSNFILNKLWTFNNSDTHIAAQFSKFFIISILGLLLNSLIIFLLTDHKFRMNFYIAKAIATLIVFLWNFLMNYFFTF